jgi:hypothetical protein
MAEAIARVRDKAPMRVPVSKDDDDEDDDDEDDDVNDDDDDDDDVAKSMLGGEPTRRHASMRDLLLKLTE